MKPTVSLIPKPTVEFVPVSAPVTQPTIDCASELGKYDWDQTQARKVMMQESGNNPKIINDNPATGDYSVGCFQVNLIGNMRNSRPPESELLTAPVNVAFAYKLWVSQGRSFCTSGGWLNTCRKVL